MPSTADTLEGLVTQVTCQKVLLEIAEGECRTVEDIKAYLKAMIKEADPYVRTP